MHINFITLDFFVFFVQGAFEILAYTNKDLNLPDTWGETGPMFIANSQEMRLRSSSTSIHKVESMIAYKA